jgi:hypothetical protein
VLLHPLLSLVVMQLGRNHGIDVCFTILPLSPHSILHLWNTKVIRLANDLRLRISWFVEKRIGKSRPKTKHITHHQIFRSMFQELKHNNRYHDLFQHRTPHYCTWCLNPIAEFNINIG